ncbi:hypothetical protein [Roseateles sp. DC23W]
MRVLVIVLLAINALFFIWSKGWLDTVSGLPAHAGREPQRLAAEQHPERIQPLAASAVAALSRRNCLELGPLDGDTALAAAQTVLRAMGAESQTRSSEQAGEWVVATIRLADPDFRARKEATYKQMRLPFELLEGMPAENPTFVMSRHASEAEAAAQLEAFGKRGLKGLRVLALKPAQSRHTLVIQADGLLANRLKASKDPALAAGFKACAAAPAASAASAG